MLGRTGSMCAILSTVNLPMMSQDVLTLHMLVLHTLTLHVITRNELAC